MQKLRSLFNTYQNSIGATRFGQFQQLRSNNSSRANVYSSILSTKERGTWLPKCFSQTQRSMKKSACMKKQLSFWQDCSSHVMQAGWHSVVQTSRLQTSVSPLSYSNPHWLSCKGRFNFLEIRHLWIEPVTICAIWISCSRSTFVNRCRYPLSTLLGTGY
jgi:hypothetical protein